ncbi:MAG TPA: hypothetical protein VNF69_13470 [Burkholderiales bacterium]|nr:hypothetical protein [Burkholderiales bacterium]
MEAQELIADLLFVVSTDRGAGPLAGLADACRRRGTRWACFFTNDGVKLLADDAVRSATQGSARAVACEHSWARFMGAAACPVELGSQTDHSALVACAARVVAL